MMALALLRFNHIVGISYRGHFAILRSLLINRSGLDWSFGDNLLDLEDNQLRTFFDELLEKAAC